MTLKVTSCLHLACRGHVFHLKGRPYSCFLLEQYLHWALGCFPQRRICLLKFLQRFELASWAISLRMDAGLCFLKYAIVAHLISSQIAKRQTPR